MSDAVFVAVLNWNGWRDTVACLQSLLASTVDRLCVAVMDNGSADTEDAILSACGALGREFNCHSCIAADEACFSDCIEEAAGSAGKGVIVYRNPKNLGFAVGSNLLLRMGMVAGFRYLMILNNDTIVEPGAIERLMKTCEGSPYRVLAPNIFLYSEPDIVWNSGGRLTFLGSRKYYNSGRSVAKGSDQVRRITFVTGCALFFRRDSLERAGFLSEDFFFGEEDFEFSMRLRELEEWIGCDYGAVIYHKVGASIKKSNQLSRSVLFYSSRLIDLRKHIRSRFHLALIYLAYAARIMGLCRLEYGYSIRISLKILRSILREARTSDVIGAERFDEIMKSDFSRGA